MIFGISTKIEILNTPENLIMCKIRVPGFNIPSAAILAFKLAKTGIIDS